MGKIHKHGYDYHGISVANLYRAFLQREPDLAGIQCYNNQTYDDIIYSIKNSHEYQQLCLSKQNTLKEPLDKKLKYTVIKINNRADDTLKLLHEQLKDDFLYQNDIKFIDSKIDDVYEFFKSRNIGINWCGDLFGHNKSPTLGELACAASHILTMEYIINNDIDEMIVFEDDVILQDDVVNILSNCLKHLPEDYDFMSDQTYEPHYEEISTVEYSILEHSKYVCRSFLQNSHTGFMLYSKEGAKNIIEQYKKYGVMCAIDTFLFWMSRRADLKGYTTYHSNRLIKYKDFIGTLIKE